LIICLIRGILKILNHIKHFKDHIADSSGSEKAKLFKMYLLVLNKRRGRGECEDHTHYTHSRGNTKISNYWDDVTKILQSE